MIKITISKEELKKENENDKSNSKRVCIDDDQHTKLKQVAADYGVSMQTVVDCFVKKLP